ncbi:glycosyltransferase family 1 protein [Halonotius aquaticus]|uniref:Glycosyltransferase family 1 protein n=1 Tax=Halonotius aquaticus TaxID=2216978 RepID=A0A3A6PYS5_9EURY|nr:glycosyltransferase family 4 protein [Halonotius aquaticus]RJX42033.1 glycosyltransferase family 1 protein [Halonotius aquaticus]
MHIGFVTSQYCPHTGGVETHVEQLATRLVDRGHTVTVIASDAASGLAETTVRDGVFVRRFTPVGPTDAFHLAVGIAPLVRRSEFDIVHAHNYHSFPFALGTLGSRVPVVCTPHYHGGSADSLRDRLLSLYRPVGRVVFGKAAAVVAVSTWERDQLAADFDVGSTVIPNGIDVDRFQSVTPVDNTDPTLLTVGRLVEYKGVQHVIRALIDLPEYRLRVAGDGPYRDALEACARAEGVDDRVEFLGYVPDSELAQQYASANVFVSMSSVEAAGITVGEALAAGTPAVVRPSKGLRDWARRDDCVSADPASLADAVGRAQPLSAPNEPLPTWDQAVDDLEFIYQNAVESAD